MNPERDSSLVDLLDRLLNKGLVLNADLIITVAGIPMIGLSLRAALASMETMLEYGMMEDWDKATREWFANQKSAASLWDDEELLFKSFGYVWQSTDIISSWVPGIWHVTNKRIFLWRRDCAEVLFEASLQEINTLSLETVSKARSELKLIYQGGISRIRMSEAEKFSDAVEKAITLSLTFVAV